MLPQRPCLSIRAYPGASIVEKDGQGRAVNHLLPVGALTTAAATDFEYQRKARPLILLLFCPASQALKSPAFGPRFPLLDYPPRSQVSGCYGGTTRADREFEYLCLLLPLLESSPSRFCYPCRRVIAGFHLQRKNPSVSDRENKRTTQPKSVGRLIRSRVFVCI